MEQIVTYLVLFGIIVIIGQFFSRWAIPLPLLLVIAGMLLSFVPFLAAIELLPSLVLNFFLPLLIYQISAFASWKDFKKNFRSITLLSVGHVVFITILVAVLIRWLMPTLDWPMAILIGAIVSPPDDVAIVAIAEKIRMPQRIITILEGEGMLNDAAALTIFRFALAAVLTHQFLIFHAVSVFVIDVITETAYGLILGYVIGELRLRINNPSLHLIASVLTPFLAYCPAVMLGGCGIVATVAVGFVIGNIYALRFTSEFRLISRAFWPAVSFAIQSFLFLLVGHDLQVIIQGVSAIPTYDLALYASAIIGVLIIGRFIWVYVANLYIPRALFPSVRKRDPHIPWQYPLLTSWAGMRGSISLAAALAVPFLPTQIEGANARDFLVFLVFSVIMVTLLIQGLALPWLLKIVGLEKMAQCEQYNEHVAEMIARKKMAVTALRWLKLAKEKKDYEPHREEIKFWIKHYRMIKNKLRDRIHDHGKIRGHDEQAEIAEDTALLLALIEVEKNTLMELWHNDKINLNVRNKLLDQLDHQAKRLG